MSFLAVHLTSILNFPSCFKETNLRDVSDDYYSIYYVHEREYKTPIRRPSTKNAMTLFQKFGKLVYIFMF